MIIHRMTSKLQNAKAEDFYRFMTNPVQETYRHWLPEEHHVFYIVRRGKVSPLGDLIYFDQHISKVHRLRFHAITRVAKKPNKLVMQMRKLGANLPAYLDLAFYDKPDHLLLTEEIRIGFGGVGRILDPIIKLFFDKQFFGALNSHHKREWACLADILAREKH